MSQFAPKEGSIVKYRGQLFYFEPFGYRCFLYDNADEIGRPFLSRFQSCVAHVYRPTEEELDAFYAKRGETRSCCKCKCHCCK